MYAAADHEEKSGDDAPPVPALSEDAVLSLSNVELKEGKTTPPKRFTEDTLLQSMESAGAEEMPEDVERKGDKKTKVLVPTDKGSALVAVVPEQIQSPRYDSGVGGKAAGHRKGRLCAG